MSIGDNDFDASADLSPENNIVFWILWVIILYVTCIIFLNFTIASQCQEGNYYFPSALSTKSPNKQDAFKNFVD